MDIKSLMVGDWIKIKTYGVSDKYERTVAYIYVKVAEIGSGLITVEYNNEIKEPYRICENTEIEPILLTPEILEKNGFKIEEEYDEIYDTHNYYATLSCVDSEKRNVEVNYSTFGNEITIFCYDRRNVQLYRRLETQIKYVHQLQHALRLCGISKEIEL